MSQQKTTISISVVISASLELVWECWTRPDHIINWNFASDEWHCPDAVNYLREQGHFSWRMEAKDGSAGFDFKGVYQEVQTAEFIAYHLEDARRVTIHFEETKSGIKLTEAFEALGNESDEMQRKGWLAILGNFKKYVEGL